MAQYVTASEELDKINSNDELNNLDLNMDNSFDIKSIIDFIIDNYKQIFLLLITVLIILVVDHITFYNNLFYSMPSIIPGVPQQPPQQKSNNLKKKPKKFKK
jgi:hypothetical protein